MTNNATMLRLFTQELLRAIKNPVYAAVALCGAVLTVFMVLTQISILFNQSPEMPASDMSNTLTPMLTFAIIVSLVIGALITTRDYPSGMIARLHRLGLGNARLVLTKVATAFVSCFCWGAIIGAIGLSVAAVGMTRHGSQFTPTTSPVVTVLGLGLACAFNGAGITAIGAILKSSLIAIIACLVYGYVIEMPISTLWPSAMHYMQSGLEQSLTQDALTIDALSFPAGLGISCAWVVAFGVAAWLTMRLRKSVN